MIIRALLLMLSISFIAACGSSSNPTPDGGYDGDGDGDIYVDGDIDGDLDGSIDGDPDEQNPEVELQINKDRNWVAVGGTSLELIPWGRNVSAEEELHELTKGTISWSITSGSEYASIEQNKRRANVSAIKPCPDDNPYCVEVVLKLDSSTGEIYTEFVQLLLKDSEDNLAPQASAGDDQVVTGGDTVALDGRKSLDLDGNVTNYAWSVVSGPLSEDVITDINTATPSFVAPESKYDQTIVLKLVVTDDQGQINDIESTVEITVLKSLENQPPVAGADQSQFSVLPGETITLSCLNSSDPDEPTLKNCEWTEIAAERTPANCPDLIFQTESPEQPFYAYIDAPETGADICQYAFDLVVVDTDGATDSLGEEHFISIVITPPEQNQKPVTIANAYPEGDSSNPQNSIAVNENTRVCLSGEGSYDPDGDSATLAFTWEQVANTADTVNPESPKSRVTCIKTPETTAEQTLKYSLTVTETAGEDPDSSKAYVEIKVLPVNSQPVAELADIEPIQTYGEVILDASGSHDTDDNETSHIVKYSWEIISTAPVLQTEYDIELLPVSPCTELANCPKAKFITPIISEELEVGISLTVEDNEGGEGISETQINILKFDITPGQTKLRATSQTEALMEWDGGVFTGLPYIEYVIEKSLDGQSDWMEVSTTAGESFQIDVEADQAFYYRVAGKYQDGIVGGKSDVMAFLPPVKNLYVTNDNQKLVFQWDSVEGATHYSVGCQLENADGSGFEKCYVKCNDIDTVGETSETKCTHAVGSGGGQDIVLNEFVENEKRVISRQYQYVVTPVFEENSTGVRSEPLKAYARANKMADITPGIGTRGRGNFVYYNGYLFAFPDFPVTLDVLIKLDPQTGQQRYISLPSVPDSYQLIRAIYPPSIVFDDENSKMYVAVAGVLMSLDLGTIDISVDLDLTRLEWEIVEIDGLDATYNTQSIIYQNNLWLMSGIGIHVIDLESKKLVGIESIFAASTIVRCQQYLYFLNEYGEEGRGFYRADISNLDFGDSAEEFELNWQLYQVVDDDFILGESFDLAFDGSHTIYFRGYYSEYNPPKAVVYLLETESVLEDNSKWQEFDFQYSTEIPLNRKGFDLIWADQLLLVVGGVLDEGGRFKYTSDYERIDLASQRWTYIPSIIQPISAATAVLFDDQLFFIGGTDESKVYDTVLAHDPESGSWNQKAAIPISTARFPAAVFEDQIKVFNNSSTVVSEYSPNEWSISAIDRLTDRFGSCAISVGEIMYILGGKVVTSDNNGEKEYSGEDGRAIEYFEKSCNQGIGCWKHLIDLEGEIVKLPSARSHHSCEVIDDRVYLLGGVDDSNVFVQGIDIFDFTAEQWIQVDAVLPKSSELLVNIGFQSAVVNDVIYFESVWGQLSVEFGPRMIGYDVNRDILLSPDDIPQFLMSRYENIGSVSMLSSKGRIYTYGGYYYKGDLSVSSPVNTVSVMY